MDSTTRVTLSLVVGGLLAAGWVHSLAVMQHNTGIDKLSFALKGSRTFLSSTSSIHVVNLTNKPEVQTWARLALAPVYCSFSERDDTSLTILSKEPVADSLGQVLWQHSDEQYQYILSRK